MPKEIVQFAQTESPNPTSLEVLWSKPEGGGNLQIHFQRHAFEVNSSDPDVKISTTDQYSDQLSRDDCNRMIRALRRARDQVYGVDA